MHYGQRVWEEEVRELQRSALDSGYVLWSDQDSVGSQTTVTMSGDALWSDQESAGGWSMVEQ
jgi:hypothetical protein